MSPTVHNVTKLDTAAAVAVKKVSVRNAEGVLHGHVNAKQMERLQFLTEKAVDFALSQVMKQFNVEVKDAPKPIISVGVNDRRQLAHFKTGRDGLGLAWRVEYNLVHLGRSEADVFGTAVHEYFHALQYALSRGGAGNYHDKEFQDWSAWAGIPTDSGGHDLGIAAGSPIVKALKSMGISVKAVKPKSDKVKDVNPTPVTGPKPLMPPVALPKPKGSSHTGWACGCTNVRVANNIKLTATCENCGEEFKEGRVAPRAKGQRKE